MEPCTHLAPFRFRERGALTGFSHVDYAGLLNSTLLLKAVSLDQPLRVGKANETHIPRTGVEARTSDHQVPTYGSIGSHVFLMTFPNRYPPPFFQKGTEAGD